MLREVAGEVDYMKSKVDIHDYSLLGAQSLKTLSGEMNKYICIYICVCVCVYIYIYIYIYFKYRNIQQRLINLNIHLHADRFSNHAFSFFWKFEADHHFLENEGT